ncbi:hypothetical protein hamaS1_29760 [Moorella sp. Hama-1]|nr:hypothetical protein hamaS1_29760 [Moorella sp. Hama-1]
MTSAKDENGGHALRGGSIKTRRKVQIKEKERVKGRPGRSDTGGPVNLLEEKRERRVDYGPAKAGQLFTGDLRWHR